jgi:hypothetical protein
VTETPEIAIEAAAKKELELTVRSDGAAFGEVSPDGTVVGGSKGLVAYVVEGGADYVIPGVVTLRIKSDTAWTITCTITDTGSWGAGSISALSWRVSGETAWRSFPSGEIILSGEAGNTRIDLDFRLHIGWSAGPGALSATVTYQAAEAVES